MSVYDIKTYLYWIRHKKHTKAHAKESVRPCWCRGMIFRSSLSMDETSDLVCRLTHTCNLAGMHACKLECEIPRRARTCPTRPSYLESLIDVVFAPPRARRPAGLKHRATNNEPRKFVSADGAILHATRKGERTPDRSGRYETDHAHVRESCNVLMRPTMCFFLVIFLQLLFLTFKTRHDLERKCWVLYIIAIL